MVRVGWLSRAHRVALEVASAALLMCVATFALAQSPVPQTTAAPAPASAPQSTAAAVGLLPVHGIVVDLDALPGADKSAAHGNADLAALQKLWDSFLKGAGFNVIEFDVDVHDLGDGGAGRVARLCGWASQNNVRIAPTLVGAAEGQPLPADYAHLAASFVGKVIATLGAGGIAGYSQIVFYQLDRPLNHPASHGAMDPAAASALLKSAAESVRAAEQAGLAQSGLQPTPLLVPSSFDYELIRRGGIAHTAISDETYTQAYGGLRDYLLTVFGSAPVEAASVEWFPGSLSSEGVDRLTDLINRLEGDLPGKLLIVDTGYSSAAGADTAQARYYQVALNNLCDLRANQGVDSPFAGILWRSAVDGGNAQGEAAAKQPPAGDVTKMWNDPKAEAREARSWLSSVQSHFGLLARAGENNAGLAPKTAYRVMSGLETALAQSPQASDALAAVKELGAAAKTGGIGQAVKSRLQSAMFGMLDSWLSQTADNLFSSPTESGPALAPGLPAPQLPDIQIVGRGEIPPNVTVGTPVLVPITLFNAGGGVATDAAIYLRDSKSDLVHTNPASLSPGGQTVVTLTWVPTETGLVKGISVEVFCSNDADPSSNRADLGDCQIDPGVRPPRPNVRADLLAAVGERTLMQSTSTPSTGSPPSGSPAAGQSRAMMATRSASGFATIEGLSAPRMMMATAPSTPTPTGSTTATRTVSGSTGPGPTASGTPSSDVARAMAPSREPVTMTLANPFNTAFRNAVATLRVDDAVVSTRPLGTLLPGQRRTVTFSEWTPPHPGSYRLRADLDGVGLLGNHLTSSAASTITVTGQSAVARMAPMPAIPTRSFTRTRSLTPLVRSASSEPVRGFGGPARGFGGRSGVRSFMVNTALSLSANSIVLRPFPPTAGAPMAVSVQLSNLEPAAARGVRVAVSVDGEALGETVTDVPASGVAMASGFKDWTAQPGRHDVRASVTVGTNHSEATKPLFVIAPGTRGFGRPGFVAGGATGVGKPGVSADAAGKGGYAFQPGFKPVLGTVRAGAAADLQIMTADIRFTPSLPSAGAAMTVTINVHNLGTGPANDGRVLAVLSAAGVEVARRQFSAAVPANGVVALEWPLTTPAGTPLLVTATATATGDINPANNQARATAAGKILIKGLTPRATIGSSR
jgi:hypothetical protein